MNAEQERASPAEGRQNSASIVSEATGSTNPSASKYKKISVDINSLSPVDTIVATNVNNKFPVTHEEDSRCYLKRAIWDSEDTTFEIIDHATPTLRINVARITAEIAKMCDGCQTKDGSGFSRIDVEIGHKVARFGIPNDWQSVRVRRWVQRLSKYSNQVCGNFYDRVFVGE